MAAIHAPTASLPGEGAPRKVNPARASSGRVGVFGFSACNSARGCVSRGLRFQRSLRFPSPFFRPTFPSSPSPSALAANPEDAGGPADVDSASPLGDVEYDPSDFAVSDEPVPDDILETLASSGSQNPGNPGVAGTPEFAAVNAVGAGSTFSPGSESSGNGFLGFTENEEQEAAERRRDLKLELLDSLFGLERGFRASSEGRAEIAELIAQLEAVNPTPAPAESPALLAGRWVLAYTSFSELLPLLAVGLVPLVRVGDIVQEVDVGAARVVNSVTFVGPFSSTTLEAAADFEIRSPKRLQIKFKEGVISPPRETSGRDASAALPSSLNLFGQALDLAPLSQALQVLQEAAGTFVRALSGLPPLKFQLGSGGSQSWLLTTYLDEDVRVSRGDGGGLFVLVKEGSPLQ